MKIFKIILWVFLWLLLLLVLYELFSMYVFVPLDVGWALLSGWFYFLQRTIPSIRSSENALLSVIVFSTLILVLSHQFCRWLYRYRATSETVTKPPVWKFRWTLIAFAGIWLIFLNIMGATGMAHQIGWLIGSDERLLKENYNRSSLDLMMATKQVEMMAEYAKWNEAALRPMLAGIEPDITSKEWMKKRREYQFTIIPGENGQVAAIIVYSFNGRDRDRDGFRVVEKDAEFHWKGYSWSQLPQMLSQLKKPSSPESF